MGAFFSLFNFVCENKEKSCIYIIEYQRLMDEVFWWLFAA